MNARKLGSVKVTLGFFALCFVFRMLEYFWLRTDQSIIGEAFVHKLAGIALLAAALHLLQWRWVEIGFDPKRAVSGILWGLLLGGGVFTVAYGAELLIHSAAGASPALQFYVTSYAISGNRALQGGAVFVLICIAGNLINVIMEEGVFRGLFPKLLGERYSFSVACWGSSILFGLWHIAQPLRNLLDGQQSPMGALMAALMLIATSTLLGVQYCMLYQVTGTIWAGMAAHFVNNTSANLLHVVTATGADDLLVLRIAVGQALSFLIVLGIFLLHRARSGRQVRA